MERKNNTLDLFREGVLAVRASLDAGVPGWKLAEMGMSFEVGHHHRSGLADLHWVAVPGEAPKPGEKQKITVFTNRGWEQREAAKKAARELKEAGQGAKA